MNFTTLASIVLVASVALCSPLVEKSAGGFGDLAWKSLGSALAAAKVSHKPIMVLIHRSHCPACKQLQPSFVASKEIAQLSKQFEMVSAGDQAEPDDAKWSPDGEYVPRILFCKPDGEVMTHVDNPKALTGFKYYHYDADTIVGAMEAALNSS